MSGMPIAVMLILVLVRVLKESLRTFFKSLSLSWSLGGQVLVLAPWFLGVRSLSLSWSLWVRSLFLSWSLWSSPCLVLVFSPCKDLFPLLHYSDLFAYYCSVKLSMHTISFNYTYLCLSCRHIALRL